MPEEKTSSWRVDALLELVADIEFDCVGGLTMGADHLSHVIAVLAKTRWFVVRKEPKGRGTNKLIEGAHPWSPGTRSCSSTTS